MPLHQTVILHLSDLHFGWEGSPKARDERAVVLNALLERLTNLDNEWKPNIICITGDLGWKGKEKDYTEAKRWVAQLLKNLNLNSKALFMCPGNHDLDRKTAQDFFRAANYNDADKALAPPIKPHFQRIFRCFINFCKDLKIPPFSLKKEKNYLVGQRSIRDMHVVCYNSSWYSRDDYDENKLWLGLPFVRAMEVAKQLPAPAELDTFEPTIALLHHPPSDHRQWFHPAEMSVERGRPNTIDYMARRCHFLLTGHTHGPPKRADRLAEAAWHLPGGAAFAGASHTNSFRLIRIRDSTFDYRLFEYDPESTDNIWQEVPLNNNNSELRFRSEVIYNLPKGTDTHSIGWDMDVDQRAVDFDHRYSRLIFSAFVDSTGNYHGVYERYGKRVTNGQTESITIQTGASSAIRYEELNVKALDRSRNPLSTRVLDDDHTYRKVYQIYLKKPVQKKRTFGIKWTFTWPSCVRLETNSDTINLRPFKRGIDKLTHFIAFAFPVRYVELWEFRGKKCQRSLIVLQRLRSAELKKFQGAEFGYKYTVKYTAPGRADGYLLTWRRLSEEKNGQ